MRRRARAPHPPPSGARVAITGIVVAITVAAGSAAAHVAPSVDDNNRYLKVTPAADRVRLAYTVFFGEVPGAQTRKTIDADRDGRISDAEAQAFGVRLAGEVAPALEVTLDGTTRPVVWSTVAVGMGTPSTAGGAFSIDLIAWLCLPSARGTHTVLVRDRFRIPRPGETEVKVEDALGITIDRTRVGPASDPGHDYRFAGPGGPLADDGLDLVYTASDRAPLTADGTCGGEGAGEERAGMPTGILVGAAAVLGGVLAALVVLVQRRRSAHRRK